MECRRAREAISARIDGEDPGMPVEALTAHLAGCPACTDWQQRAHTMTRRTRLGGPFLDRDLTASVLAVSLPVHGPRRHELAQRAGLVAVALAQLAITVPLLVLGHDHDAGMHAAHELGSFNLALAIAFAIGAIRPALSAGLAWPCGIAAAGLAGTAIADLFGGQTIGADEAQHLIAVFGAVLLCWQARTYLAGTTGPALTAARDQASPHFAAGPAPVMLLERPPDFPGGIDVARVAASHANASRACAAQPAAADRGEPGRRLDGAGTASPGQDGAEAVA